MGCGFEWQDGSLVFTMLADVGETKDGKKYLKKWSFNNGKDWIYPCELDYVETIELKNARGGEYHDMPSAIDYAKGKYRYIKGLDAKMELERGKNV